VPLASVVVPTFNGAAFIEDCLRSVRSSSLRDHELIVVDDGSGDGTADIAKRYADTVIEHRINEGRHAARCAGIRRARGDIVVQLDQDVVLPADALGRLHEYFAAHADVDAATAPLAPEHPRPRFFAEYKNLYMHYVFRDLPPYVEFLYGSLFVLRRSAFDRYRLEEVSFGAHDTAWGQRIALHGGTIALLKDLPVVHLKDYSLLSLMRNDFDIPFQWAQVFVAFRRWRGLRRRRTAFAHASWRQLLTILLACAAVPAVAAGAVWSGMLLVALGLVAAWLALNARFFSFIARAKGASFAARATALTFLDCLVMGVGVAAGLCHALLRRRRVAQALTSDLPAGPNATPERAPPLSG